MHGRRAARPDPGGRPVRDAQPAERRPGLAGDGDADRQRRRRAQAIAGPPPDDAGPTPRPAAFDPAQRAAGLLGVKSPFAVGTAGNLRLYAKSRATKLGKPKALQLLAAAVCSGGTCAGKATAKLTLTPRRAASAPTRTLVKRLRLADRGAIALR